MKAQQDGLVVWREFFNTHAPHYDQNPFTANTKAEVDFFLALFPIPAGAKILDVGCGTGRHAVELASRGYQVTGLDLSENMLEQAKQKAEKAGVQVTLLQADATDFSFDEPFDAAICLCEGGVGLIGAEDNPEEHDAKIFQNIAASLKPNAPFLMTALNGYSIIRQMKDEFVEQGSFNPSTMVARYKDEMQLPEGPTTLNIRERLFIPPEMVRMLREAGFEVHYVYGGTAGDWGQRPLKLDEIEAMYVCRKKS